MPKRIIIVVGMWGVGKSYHCKQWIEEHPEYRLFSPETTMVELSTGDYWIGDYYFARDWNAENLRKIFPGCPVEIRVIFDDPEIISYRQIFHKHNMCPVQPGASIRLYEKDMPELLHLPGCRFHYKGQYITLQQYYRQLWEFQKPYTEKQVLDHIKWMRDQEGYDWEYQHFDLPYGHRIGRDGYAMNEYTWRLMCDITTWKNRTVLEIGCFHGYFCQQILYRGGIPTGIDIHCQALYSAGIFQRMFDIEYELIKMDVEHYYPQKDFDIVLCMNIFHHIKNQDQLIENMKRAKQVVFEVNTGDIPRIADHFNIVKEIDSPKVKRVIMLCEPKP